MIPVKDFGASKSRSIYYKGPFPNVFGKSFFYRIAAENNVEMIGFVSFPWKYNFLRLVQGVGIETHFLLISPCFNFAQVIIGFTCRGIQIIHYTKQGVLVGKRKIGFEDGFSAKSLI